MAEDAQPDMGALTRAIRDVFRSLTIAAQEIIHFVNSPTIAEGNQILHLLAVVQAQIPPLVAIVNENDIIAQNTHNALMGIINGHIAEVIEATTSALSGLTSA